MAINISLASLSGFYNMNHCTFILVDIIAYPTGASVNVVSDPKCEVSDDLND